MTGPENDLVQRAVGGDPATLTELFERHGPTVRHSVATTSRAKPSSK